MFKRPIILISCLLLFQASFGQDIHSTSAVVLPATAGGTYSVPSGQTVNITSAQSITLNPGVTLSSGSIVNMGIANPIIYPIPPSNPSNDSNLNWVLTHTYDENGNEIGATKAFFDNNGKSTQTQTKNESTGHVLASQALYDLQQRSALTTLAAPINNSSFAYDNSFVTNNNVSYSYVNFDGDPTVSTYGKVNSADPIDNKTTGSLGWYYSNNNTFDPMVPATSYPYSRVDYFSDGTGAAKRSAGVGEQLNMGANHEAKNVQFPVINELNNYLAIRNQFFPSAIVGASPTTMAGSALQSISTDQNGMQVLSVTDLGGKQTLMTARADPNGYLSVANTLNLSNVQPMYSFLVATQKSSGLQTGGNTPPGNGGIYISSYDGFSINSENIVTVYLDGTQIYNGQGNNYVYTALNAVTEHLYQITSGFPFTISTSAPGFGPIYDQAEAQYQEPSGTAIQYFQLTVPSVVTITGNYTLYNMATETDITSTFTSGQNLPVGYYKVMATAPVSTGTSVAATNNVTVTYSNKYSDVSYNYYNQLGQLIGSIAPNGVYLLNHNGLSTYNTVSAVPFLTQNSYDLQGRLTSSTSPDAGTTNFIYRQDGKIRFSQNTAQTNASNAGTGNVEKFSYTNYDQIGRPIESGEYAVPTATFASLASNTTLLEKTDPTGGLSGGTKTTQINTLYDVPDPNLATVNSAYVQDPGFLKGAVSYTQSATNGIVNSTTWYNYDDHDRVTWVVKQLAGFGTQTKTIDYTYNAQGNVTTVNYQKNTPAEQFIHYYAYDADGRLINVQTSRNGTTMVQQAHYYYYLHGPLKRTELGNNLQGIDYVYTPQGWLKSINSPTGDPTKDPMQDGVANEFAKDAFGMQLEYFNGDYTRTGSNVSNILTGNNYYNGNVTGMSWQSLKPSSVAGTAGIQNPTMYTYTYDPKYQMTGATWGTPNFSSNSFTSSTLYSETVTPQNYNGSTTSYDFNGNIMGIQRTNSLGVLSDDFSQYTYATNATTGNPTNQLASVGNAASSASYASYTYNELGQLKTEVQPGLPAYYIAYDVTGKITAIYPNATLTGTALVSYTYDESGNRISRTDNNGTSNYVYDATGNVMAIYSGTTMEELPVYGSNRLGTYTVSSNNYVYELRDNVGSVRAVINQTNISNQPDVITYNDYYPFGSLLRSGGPGYRYDYQGAYAEKDAATLWNNFELRMYDGKIGRWLNTDPDGQFASPYEGMGNNPVTGIDKTGGFWQELGNWITGNGWISNAGVDFMQSHPGSQLGDWTGSRLTGYATVSYPLPSESNAPANQAAGVGFKPFNAVQDYTFNGIDVYLDYTMDVKLGLDASAIIKGLEGFDINMGSFKLASYSFVKNEWERSSMKNFEYSEGFSIDHEGVGGGGEFSLETKDGNVESFKLTGEASYYLANAKANYDVIKNKFGADVGLEGKIGVGLTATVGLKIVIEQHNSVH